MQWYWKDNSANKKWKIIVYDAIIKSKLLYGLETVHLTKTMCQKINAFHLRGLRKILDLKTTYLDRNNSNQRVLQAATQIAYAEQPERKIELFSEQLKQKRIKLAGHILRANEVDPLRQVSYQTQSAKIYDIGKRRIGGPRQQWLFHTNKYIWEEVITSGLSTYEHTDQQNDRIIDLATRRLI